MTNALEKVPGKVDLYSEENDWFRVTVRARGKAHRALADSTGHVHYISCTCPGSKNGSLRNKSSIILNGWDKANCGN